MNKKLIMCLIIMMIVSLIFGCASVPKEVVELSYQTGKDIASLQESYDNLIHQFYKGLRSQRIDYLENKWTPRFIDKWIKNGELIRVAKGELVWSEDSLKFIHSVDNSQKQMLETVQLWADEAIYQIENKRSELLNPLNQEEDSLRLVVAQAFSQVIQGNATITAHLNSIREVKEIQDDALKALGIHSLREQINGFLVDASHRAAKGLDELKDIDDKMEEATKQLNR